MWKRWSRKRPTMAVRRAAGSPATTALAEGRIGGRAVQGAGDGGAVGLALHEVARRVGDRVQARLGGGGAAQRGRQARQRQQDGRAPRREEHRLEGRAGGAAGGGAGTANEARGRTDEAARESLEGAAVADREDVVADDVPAGADGASDRRVGGRRSDASERPGAGGHLDARDLVLEQRSEHRAHRARIACGDRAGQVRGPPEAPDGRDRVAAVGRLVVDPPRHGHQLGASHAHAGRGRGRRGGRGRGGHRPHGGGGRPAGGRQPCKGHGRHCRCRSHGVTVPIRRRPVQALRAGRSGSQRAVKPALIQRSGVGPTRVREAGAMARPPLPQGPRPHPVNARRRPAARPTRARRDGARGARGSRRRPRG